MAKANADYLWLVATLDRHRADLRETVRGLGLRVTCGLSDTMNNIRNSPVSMLRFLADEIEAGRPGAEEVVRLLVDAAAMSLAAACQELAEEDDE